MCGLAGYRNFDGSSAHIEPLQRMAASIAHRGPDGEGFTLDGPFGMTHRRLAIIDLSSAASQPMTSSDGRYVIAYNGEIYNFQELRRELEALGYIFKSRSDTEVALNALIAWGPRAIERFNGMFAFALWDREEKRLLLARDRYGIKPLYWRRDDKTFIFGSEIKAILAHGQSRAQVHLPALLEYFTFQNLFADYTLFAGVQLLQPGHYAVLEPNGYWRMEKYWEFDFREPEIIKDMAEYEEETHRLFTQAVKRQLVADVPVGAYLSGGMDSGGVTAVATREQPHLLSITAGFDMSGVEASDSGLDERVRAETLSTKFRTEHYQVVLKSGDMERSIPSVVRHIEDLRVGQSYPNWYVSRLAGRMVKVILAGTGGDELFGGYPWRYYRAAGSLDFADYVERYYRFWHRLVPNAVIHRLFQPEIWNEISHIRTINTFRSVLESIPGIPKSPEDYVNRSLSFECKTFLHGLLMVEDRLSMANGLEVRVPFLDNDLVDFAQRLPVRAKLRDLDLAMRIDENQPGDKSGQYIEKTNDGKIVLRNVLDKLLPPEYAFAIKQGFSGPDASWFRKDSAEFVRQTILLPDSRIYAYLRPDTIGELVNEHLDGKENRRLLIWSLISFEWWLREFT
jgi:asparagine synthase (glutamine-hydrolysing)